MDQVVDNSEPLDGEKVSALCCTKPDIPGFAARLEHIFGSWRKIRVIGCLLPRLFRTFVVPRLARVRRLLLLLPQLLGWLRLAGLFCLPLDIGEWRKVRWIALDQCGEVDRLLRESLNRATVRAVLSGVGLQHDPFLFHQVLVWREWLDVEFGSAVTLAKRIDHPLSPISPPKADQQGNSSR